MTDDTIPPFSFPAVHAKKVTAAFDGGRLTSNGGVMLLAMAERRLGLANRAGPGCLDSAPLDLSGFLPGYAERGALRFCRCVGRA
ncbi:hypothetical protein ACVIHA_008898 [Bradyrhizobium liaoningense]